MKVMAVDNWKINHFIYIYGADSTQKFSNAIQLDEEFSLKFHSCAQGFASSCTLLLERKSREQATLYDEPTT